MTLTHANLLSNIRAMGEASEVAASDVFVSWLPLYHDMGLIGAWLSCLYFGVPLAVMSPLDFLARPAQWLWAIHANQGTLSAAPNFAYELCLRKIADAELDGLDLGSLRILFNGAEPVSADTVTRFGERFAAYGLRREAQAPVYGLAEACVGLTLPPVGRGPIVDRIDRNRFLRTGKATRAAADDPDPLRFVGCGRTIPGHQIRLVDSAGNVLGDRREGRIEFCGPSATAGYFRNPRATTALLRHGWLDTGDLGYFVDGELYVTGRIKDFIIRAGRNLHPEELERAVGDIPEIRKGCVAAFATAEPAGGTERLVVFAETRQTAAAAVAQLRETDHRGQRRPARHTAGRCRARATGDGAENLQRQAQARSHPGALRAGRCAGSSPACVVAAGPVRSQKCDPAPATRGETYRNRAVRLVVLVDSGRGGSADIDRRGGATRSRRTARCRARRRPQPRPGHRHPRHRGPSRAAHAAEQVRCGGQPLQPPRRHRLGHDPSRPLHLRGR
ncbi:AMP-binding protein [Nocardia rhizosphaerihabitans]|uniref:AMP-dependent synthetase/ligase domain-containing protein n=1 Tax=Nocardia rhizosphaerihabitans TaxID=1691570 RepID=A0ABQ2K8J1_9NOCA|nr:AMP-binding protein [Nocardia rhizosphaerihabitans]GGN71916.1 hypothetical protein GCM10011610_12700 [Nocardia rhizosphaerihabitans]